MRLNVLCLCCSFCSLIIGAKGSGTVSGSGFFLFSLVLTKETITTVKAAAAYTTCHGSKRDPSTCIQKTDIYSAK